MPYPTIWGLSENHLNGQARAGRAVYLLITTGPMTSQELTEALGYRDRFAVYDLMEKLSPAIPLYFNEGDGTWRVLCDDF